MRVIPRSIKLASDALAGTIATAFLLTIHKNRNVLIMIFHLPPWKTKILNQNVVF